MFLNQSTTTMKEFTQWWNKFASSWLWSTIFFGHVWGIHQRECFQATETCMHARIKQLLVRERDMINDFNLNHFLSVKWSLASNISSNNDNKIKSVRMWFKRESNFCICSHKIATSLAQMHVTMHKAKTCASFWFIPITLKLANLNNWRCCRGALLHFTNHSVVTLEIHLLSLFLFWSDKRHQHLFACFCSLLTNFLHSDFACWTREIWKQCWDTDCHWLEIDGNSSLLHNCVFPSELKKWWIVGSSKQQHWCSTTH